MEETMNKVFTVKVEGRDTDGKKTETLVEIPDGKWVVYVNTSWMCVEEYESDDDDSPLYRDELKRTAQIVGPNPEKRIVLSRDSSRSGGGIFAIDVGDVPFGVVFEELHNGEREGGLYFVCSRQVHKGELGRRPLIERPKFAREAPPFSESRVSPLTDKPIKSRNLRRGKDGWARLGDVAKLVGMTPEQTVRSYFAFTHADRPRLDVRFAEHRDEIHMKKLPSCLQAYFDDIGMVFVRAVHDDEIWIRQGFANVILYLHHFGYVPKIVETTAA